MTVFFFIIFRVLLIYDTRKMALLHEETMQRHCAAAYLCMNEKAAIMRLHSCIILSHYFGHQPYEHINFLFLKVNHFFSYVRSLRLTDKEALNKPAGSTFIWSHFTKGNQMYDYSFRCLCTYSVQKASLQLSIQKAGINIPIACFKFTGNMVSIDNRVTSSGGILLTCLLI